MRSYALHMESVWRKPSVEAPRREIILPRTAYVAGAILLAGAVVYWRRDVLTWPGVAGHRGR
jgi:hypothetical protein